MHEECMGTGMITLRSSMLMPQPRFALYAPSMESSGKTHVVIFKGLDALTALGN